MNAHMQSTEINQFLDLHQLPTSYSVLIDRYFLPLVDTLYVHLNGAKKPLVIGLNGAQGSGKTTLGDFLVHALTTKHGLNVVGISLDDFYLTKQQRIDLSKSVHPLFETRGVPGTHDLPLAMNTLQSLIDGKETAIPRFNKALDDRFAEVDWDIAPSGVDVIVFEGWCNGAVAQLPEELVVPVNKLESDEDPDLVWRQYINQQLLNHYPHLFNLVDQWIMLKAPSFDCVYNWRLEQEHKLAKRLESETADVKSSVMTDEEVARFIRFYQRITENILKTLPEKVNYLFELDKHRQVFSASSPRPVSKSSDANPSLLVFTDMDGSLLNHFDYNFEATKPLLNKLRNQQIPVIPCTSKTAAELMTLREEMKNEAPFISENGAAVFIPVGTFLQQPADTILKDGFWVKAFTESREHWLGLIEQLKDKYKDCFTHFNQMTLAEIVDATGLDEQSAKQASQRQFGEPVMWLADEYKKAEFIDDLKALGANVLQGGRFIHVSGHTDKGKTLKWLTEQYQQHSFMTKPIKTLAIGDSQNDVAMLEAASIALLMPSTVHDLPKVERDSNTYIASAIAPEGWQQGVEQIITDLESASKEMANG
jgi:D-glycerate 3-kinase